MWAQSYSMVALEWINDASQRELDSNCNILLSNLFILLQK